MNYKDYYKVMGLERNATQDEIKRAYRKLARKYHPDVSKEADAEARFKQLGEAYEVLKDPEKRAAYDRLGSSWKPEQEFRPPPDWDAGFEFTGGGYTGAAGGDYSDFFEALFGRGFGAGHHAAGPFRGRGDDHHVKVLIDLEDAFHGATRSISLQAPQLDAQGHVSLRERTLSVRIPKGIREHQQIRLKGQGAAGVAGGAAGDLYLQIQFRTHPLYRVEGRDLYLDLPLAPWEAALGCRVKVPNPAGSLDLTVPPGTASGRKLRLKGRGIPASPAGDYYLLTRIVLPPDCDARCQELYRELQRQSGFNPRRDWGVQ